MTKDMGNPVETLSLPLRIAAGPVVSKLYTEKDPKFMNRVESIGPRGAALLICRQVLVFYTIAFLVAGYVVRVTADAGLSSVLIPLSLIFAFWAVVVLISANKAAQDFRGCQGDGGDTPA
jgi:hypothetical protein